jgi:hypothetical protein
MTTLVAEFSMLSIVDESYGGTTMMSSDDTSRRTLMHHKFNITSPLLSVTLLSSCIRGSLYLILTRLGIREKRSKSRCNIHVDHLIFVDGRPHY